MPFQECDDFFFSPFWVNLPVIYIYEGSVNPEVIFCLFFFGFSRLVSICSCWNHHWFYCSHHTAFMTSLYWSQIESNSDISHSGGCCCFKERKLIFGINVQFADLFAAPLSLIMCVSLPCCRVPQFAYSTSEQTNTTTIHLFVCVFIEITKTSRTKWAAVLLRLNPVGRLSDIFCCRLCVSSKRPIRRGLGPSNRDEDFQVLKTKEKHLSYLRMLCVSL